MSLSVCARNGSLAEQACICVYMHDSNISMVTCALKQLLIVVSRKEPRRNFSFCGWEGGGGEEEEVSKSLVLKS